MKPRYQNKENLISQMRHARIMTGMTQEEVAKKLKTSQSSIARAEKDTHTTLVFAEKYVRACGFLLRLNHISIESLDGKVNSSSFTKKI
jgi:DNA-binding XRE family transcriptional regulator